MPHIYIDGKRIEAKNGETIIQAAYSNGIQIPHFCWHPELSVSGNCRMCLVEIGMPKKLQDGSVEVDSNGNVVVAYMPKLQIACATPVTDGMYINTNNDKVTDAQESVMEFLLINHPLDCPICDEAGECKLQEYGFTHSKGESRFDEVKNHKDKRQEWGPNVMYDAERCISCSRCIRFAKEVAKQDVLTFVNRGDHVTIKLFEGTKFDNPYSMNVIEACPVGALTSKDFRFKSRVWDMSFNDSVTAHDATGSNISIGVKNNEILRIEPKTNMYVNRYWLTDDLRKDFKYVNENRILDPMIKVNGSLISTTWDKAYSVAADELKKYKGNDIFVLASPLATNEDNYLLAKFAKMVLKTQNIDSLPRINNNIKEDNFLLVKDKSPNQKGLLELNITNSSSLKAMDLVDNIKNGKIKALYIMEEDFKYYSHIIDVLDQLDLLIVHSYNHNSITEKADIVFATSTFAEIEGTFTNKDKRVQHFTPALVTKENYRIMGMKMSRLDKFGAPNDRWTQHELRNCRQSWRSIMNLAGLLGSKWDYSDSEDIFEEITNQVASFKNMNYPLLDEHQGLVLNKANNPEPKILNYQSHVMKPH